MNIINNVQVKNKAEHNTQYNNAENKSSQNNPQFPSTQPNPLITNYYQTSQSNFQTQPQTQSLSQTLNSQHSLNLNLNNNNNKNEKIIIDVEMSDLSSPNNQFVIDTSFTTQILLSQYPQQNYHNIEPQKVNEYIHDIFLHLKQVEHYYLPKYGYMKTNQNDINEKMRSILTDWLVEVHMKFKLVPETLFLTIHLIDRFLEKKQISRTKLQLIGISAMLIACKYEEIYSPEVRDFVYITDQAYTKEDVLAMESEMLKTFEFNVTSPSTFRFLEVYNCFIKLDDRSFMFCRYLLELFLIDYRMLKYNPSLTAASTIYIALKITKKIDCDQIPSLTSYSEDKLRDCAKDICIILDGVDSSNLKAVRKKFQSPKFLEVSTIKFH